LPAFLKDSQEWRLAVWSLGFWGGGRCGLDFGLNIFAKLWAICAIKDVDNRLER
jgi:hypothetical protein